MENNETGLNKLTDTIENVITGVPAPVRKNFIKAFGQLCTAAVDVPVAWLEGKSEEIRATTEARRRIIQKEGEEISEQIKVPQEYISKASSKFAAKVIKEQLNLDQISFNAANELSNLNQTGTIEKETEDISDDWLNEFENLARVKSTEDIKLVFGKILAGEIIKPGTFSIKTIKLISELDNEAAKLFQLLCSNVTSMRTNDEIWEARVISFKGSAASNSLKQFGLSFSALNVLEEYGMIISDYNSWAEYSSCIINEQNEVGALLHFRGKNYVLVPSDKEKYDKVLKLTGVSLTKAGKELLDIIPLTKVNDYEDQLIEFFESKHLDLLVI